MWSIFRKPVVYAAPVSVAPVCAAESLLANKLRELDELLAGRQEIRREQAELRKTLTRARRGAGILEAKVVRSEELLLAAQEAVEKTSMSVALTNDAQASRYFELKKRLDSYDKIFQQLGIVITRQVIAPAVAVPDPAAR